MAEMMDTLLPLLAKSGAIEEFKRDVAAYASYQDAQRISTARHSPRIKVLRLLAQLLSAEPALVIHSVRVDAMSGCADFRGTATVDAGGDTRVFEFVWDCHWRAIQEGWVDPFGLPDQIRAAREFGWRCFERWRERRDPTQVPAGAASPGGEY